MSDPNDEMQYVTRKELREELAPIHAVLELIVEKLEVVQEQSASKEQLVATEQRVMGELRTLRGEIRATEERLMIELGRHARASNEEVLTQIRVLDDKYSDVHPRLEALEARPPEAPTRARPMPRKKRAGRRR